jgi:ABC-2 type transport system ATP-binding protein
VRDLLDDQPLAVRIDVGEPRKLANLLLDLPEVVGIELRGAEGLVVHARQPRVFFRNLGRVVSEEGLEIRHLQALDESAQALLGYLMRGRRRG